MSRANNDFICPNFEELVSRIKEILRSKDEDNVVILCIGNPLRGDDGLGYYIAKRLIERGIKNVINAETAPENYLLKIVNIRPKILIIIDAINFNQRPGTIFFSDLSRVNIIHAGILTTHNVPLDLMIKLIKQLLGIEIKAYLLGIQVKQVELGAGLSSEVRRSADLVTKALCKILG